ncbi:Calcium/calmodulin-dependent protein kinase kinase 2 [Harpegnathos saltator]|uniref:Calcium/calmodulin-dependent protein kinase kinase 2 n=1 Tax=Harpegnathos saltator TaxID=610380 RepID=E2BDK2_HARSA|nr:Calcium/calmodulin-dependent protein kinase kinase 2 [Harpegnathos saltator]
MGVTLYSLVTGSLPWNGSGSIGSVYAAARSENLKFPEKPAVSDDLRDLITRMLMKEPADRIILPEIKQHAWLTNRGAEPLPNEADNCRVPVTVTDEEVERVVTRVPKLDTLILIKTMLKQHSFQVSQRHACTRISYIYVTRKFIWEKKIKEINKKYYAIQ